MHKKRNLRPEITLKIYVFYKFLLECKYITFSYNDSFFDINLYAIKIQLVYWPNLKPLLACFIDFKWAWVRVRYISFLTKIVFI